jgi:pyridoxamine 5'-phosphate oxidase
MTPSDGPGRVGRSIADLRLEYRFGELLESQVPADPFELFEAWFGAVLSNPGTDEPTAMTLATADADGAPSARTVLLKGLDHDGLCWYTNYGSRKGRELEARPVASLVFRWATFERQVIAAGPVERTSAAESDAYFQSRPTGSQVGAIISAQSTVIEGRERLEADHAALLAEAAAGRVLHRPPSWGGFRLRPVTFEFWQGRPSRVHDRLRYRRSAPHATDWVIERLSP